VAKKKLGEILVSTGAASGADVAAALADQAAGEPSRLGDLLVATGKLSSSALARALAEQYQLPYVDLPQLPQAVLDLVPMDLQRQFRIVPLKSEDTELYIAMADLANIEVLAVLEQQWSKVHVHVAGGDEIDALHATLSGLFSPAVGTPAVPTAPTADDLFGSLDLEELEVPTALAPTGTDPSPVPVIAPVSNELHAVPRPSPVAPTSAPPSASDLFGDLNLDSGRSGIAARPPEDPISGVIRNVTLPLGAVTVTEMVAIPDPAPSPPEAEIVPEALPEAELVQEGSGPVLVGVREGTGPLLDMLLKEGSQPLGDLLLMKEGTGPVVDTPFASASAIVPPVADAPPFSSSRSSLSALAIPPPEPTVPSPEVTSSSAPEPLPPPVAGDALPDWLRGDAGAAQNTAESAVAWTGALDHLMPSKLVVGLTKVLLAKGLITEAEILAALGQGPKKS
jgi:hypothetical protein